MTHSAGCFHIFPPFPLVVTRLLSRDMILLGMKPSTSEAQVREYFKDKADVVMVQVLDIRYQSAHFNFTFS